MTKDFEFEEEYNKIIDILLDNEGLIQSTYVILQMTGSSESRKWYVFVPYWKGGRVYVESNLHVESKSLPYSLTSLKRKINKYFKDLKSKGVTEISCECCKHGKRAKWSKKDVYYEGCPYSGHSHGKIKFCVFFEASKKKNNNKK